MPQLGRVILEDDVEVGANTTIDRGSAQDTVIGAGSRLDNLVQIGHNVVLGRCCVIVAQVGISGSTVLEDFIRVGGQAAMAGHLRIGRGAQIGAQSGVISDVPAGAAVLGARRSRSETFSGKSRLFASWREDRSKADRFSCKGLAWVLVDIISSASFGNASQLAHFMPDSAAWPDCCR